MHKVADEEGEDERKYGTADDDVIVFHRRFLYSHEYQRMILMPHCLHSLI